MADFPSSGKALDLLSTLGRTLANGNSTSGTSLIVTAGDGIVGEDATSGPAGDVNIAGGDNTGAAGPDDGGGVIMSGGSANAGDGGPVSAIAGDSTSGAGGDVVLTPGTGPTNDGVVRFVNPADTALETTASWGPGNFTWLSPDGQAATDAGIGLTLTAGDGNTTGTPGAINLNAGNAGTDSLGGEINITAGDGAGSENNGGGVNIIGGGASDGNGGIIDIEGGPGTGSGRQGGLVRIQGGTPGTDAAGGAVQILGRAGNGTGGGGGITLTAANSGAGATGNGGQILGNAGDANSTNGNGGDITWAAGDGNGTGTNGRVILLTSDIDAPVRIRTTSGFSGTELDTFTYGAQTTIGTSSTSDITLGTLDTNGRNAKIEVYITGVQNGTDGEVNSATIFRSFYRASGTVTALGTHISDTQVSNPAGATFATDITYSITNSGDTLVLRITNGSGTASYTGNFAVRWSIQEGGFTS